jgi:DNA repair exonuclease SbcCD ATPase subunit
LPSPEELNDINFVKEQNMSLNEEKQDIEEFYKNILLKLNEDDKRREEEMRLQVINMNSHLKYLEQKNKKLENLNYALNSKYMDLKYDFDLNNEKISKEIENNKNKNNLLLKGISDSRKKAKLENDLNQKEYNKRSRQVASTLRNQIKTNKETGILANKQLNEIQKIYEEKLNLFKNKYDIAEAKYNLLKENRYHNENLEIRNEIERRIIALRERMKQHEEYIVKIKQIVEGDYDHYEKIKDITQNKNRIFFDDLKETENQIQQFVDIIPLNDEMEEYDYEEEEQNGDEINN